MDSDLPIWRQALQLLVSAPQFLPLLWRQLGQKLHALQGLVAFIGRQAVEFFQPITQCFLMICRELLEAGFIFQKFDLLIERKVFMCLEPLAHLASAFLSGMIGAIRAFLRRGLYQKYRRWSMS